MSTLPRVYLPLLLGRTLNEPDALVLLGAQGIWECFLSTSSASRRLILCPDINPFSFVLLFEKGTGGQSWSIRDYSTPNSVSVRYAREFNFDLTGLHQRTIRAVDAPTTSTANLQFWHQLTLETNARLLADSQVDQIDTRRSGRSDFEEKPKHYPLLDHERLMSSPKARKEEDIRRMLGSPNSEDWVTWNAFAIVQRAAPHAWWQHLVHLACTNNAEISLPAGWVETPSVCLWRVLPAPQAYEMASRDRMRNSGILPWMRRSHDDAPVEGDSEIDICLRNKALTVFVEAKLGSDISLRTTYDPNRNQIVRNIDCLIESVQQSVPMFWMLVRDSGTKRAYTQLLQKYRLTPSTLAEALPHRSPSQITRIAQTLSLVLWKDFVSVVPEPKSCDELLSTVYQELMRRIR